MSLCFDEAFQALRSQQISEQEYLHQVLAHFCGTRHPADEKAKRPWEVMINDPVGNAIREAALNSPSKHPETVAHLESLFLTTLKDDASTFDSLVSKTSNAQPVPLQALTTFAALHSDAQVLRSCLQKGASLSDRNTCIALEFAPRGSALLDVLYEYDWKDIRTSRLAFNRMVQWSLHTGPEELSWFISKGAKIDKEVIRHAAHGTPVKAACIALLLSRFGVDLFRGTRLLQSAAKRGRNESVKILLDAGVNVDELVPPSPTHEDGEAELTALYEAVYKHHEDTVRLLLQYGADPEKPVCEEGLCNTPLKLAQGHGYDSLVALMSRAMERKKAGGRHRWHTAKF